MPLRKSRLKLIQFKRQRSTLSLNNRVHYTTTTLTALITTSTTIITITMDRPWVPGTGLELITPQQMALLPRTQWKWDIATTPWRPCLPQIPLRPLPLHLFLALKLITTGLLLPILWTLLKMALWTLIWVHMPIPVKRRECLAHKCTSSQQQQVLPITWQKGICQRGKEWIGRSLQW